MTVSDPRAPGRGRPAACPLRHPNRTWSNEQLQEALNSRVIIEQAKGILSERTGVEIDHAFATLRRYARNHNLGLTSVAGTVIDGTPDAAALLSDTPPTAV